MPQRIQRKRSKGWKMPDGCVYVGRPGYFGNPFVISNCTSDYSCYFDCPHLITDTIEKVIENYKWYLEHTSKGRMVLHRAKQELKGKDLVCWCKVGEPCHADILLELANTTQSTKQ